MSGLSVETALGAAEGWRLMTQSTWGLVLCDYNMPGQTGAELITALRKWEATNRRHTQLVYGITAGVEDKSVRALCLDAGMSELWGKPLDVHLVTQTLAISLEQPNKTTR